MVTHAGLTAGYQIAQVAHATADFALYHTEEFQQWHRDSQYIVALQARNIDELKALAKTKPPELQVLAFNEPDLGNELTALAFIPHELNRRYLSKLKLAGSQTGVIDKHIQTKSGV